MGNEIEVLNEKIKKGQGVAMVTLIEVEGSSPGIKGSIMIVDENERIAGTVGGGRAEHMLIEEAKKSIKNGESKEVNLNLTPEGDSSAGMMCGGSIKGYIKVFQRRRRVLIVGGGHLGKELYEEFKNLDFDIIVFDDREEYVEEERFPKAKERIFGNIEKSIKNFEVSNGDYVIIVTRGHSSDKEALKGLSGKNPSYIGMIGSRGKIKATYNELLEEGFEKEELERVEAPVGLDIDDGTPREIAIGIVAQVLMKKNRKSGKALRDVKKVTI